MAIPRTFLDWSLAALPQAADWLIRTSRIMNHVDLSDTIVVLPGKRAGRRLLELLVERTHQRNWRFSRPTVTTAGQLPELLYEPKYPFASNLVQQLAWTHALRQTDRSSLWQVIPELPDPDDDKRWLELGELLSSQHRELAADGHSFADVASRGAQHEASRWSSLQIVQETYLALLDQLGLWDLQTARLSAVRNREFLSASTLSADASIVLVGTVDMNLATRQVLDQVADRVHVLIHAPESEQAGFDRLGCLKPEYWTARPVAIQDEQICLADDPDDQDAVVAGILAGYGGRCRADEITVGVCDEQIVQQLQSSLTLLDVPTRWLVDRDVTETLPCRFLSALADYLDDRRFSRFAGLVRHFDVEAWLLRKGVSPEWLSELDRYYDRHLPSQIGEWHGPEQRYAQIRDVHAIIELATRSLRQPRRSPADWSPLILQLILTLYGDVNFDRSVPHDSVQVSALQIIHRALLDLTRIPHEISLQLTASETIHILLDQLAGETLTADQSPDSVEILGWLELPLDDAPSLIVTSFNDGFVPRSITSDLFLPNELRSRLGLVDSVRYHARDAYAVNVLLASREQVHFIVPRRGIDDQPLLPGRLLFSVGGEAAAGRCLSYFGEESESTSAVRIRPSGSGSGTGAFTVPAPLPQPALTSISVTAFRTYLECPYRFYLRHVLKLEHLSDSSLELSPLQFGNLAHEVLDQFGKSDLKSSTSPDQILKFLESRLDSVALREYGRQRMAAIEIQLIQLRKRLESFASWQAERASDGWEIRHAEAAAQKPVNFTADDGREIELRGRIDRIDFHPGKQEWEIFDYKTSESERTPNQSHRRKTGDGTRRWVDLQLPLYRHLAKPLEVHVPRLGYIVLPKGRDAARALYADWTSDELESADAEARRVAGRILDGEFLPVETLKRESDDFSAICQSNVFQKQMPPGSTSRLTDGTADSTEADFTHAG